MDWSRYGLAVWCFAVVPVLVGCSVSRQQTAIDAGGNKMTAAELRALLPASVIALEEAGMTGRISLSPNGTMTAENSDGAKDTGRWQVDDNNRLCLKFRTWSYGDTRCHTIVAAGDTYRQFNASGLPVGSFRIVSSGAAVTDQRQRTVSGMSSGLSTGDTATAAGSRRGSNEKKDVDMIMRAMAKNCPSCNLAEARLAGAMLIGANLEGADLRRADLRNAVLRRARLRNAYLPGADLTGADLAGADFVGADLTGADLTGANLYKTRLEGAVLHEVHGADFTGAYR